MVGNTKVSGRMARLAAKVDFGMRTATHMKVNGCRIKQTDTDYIYTLMELSTWVTGKTMFNTVGDRKLGQMAQDSKGIIMMERNMVMVHTTGQMVLHLPGAGLITKLMALESTRGQMDESLKATGKITICTAKESTLGLMVAATKEIMKMIRNMAMAFTPGATVVSIAVIGLTGSSTVREFTDMQMGTVVTAFGRRASELCGSTIDSNFYLQII
jgi:hypothetical protein